VIGVAQLIPQVSASDVDAYVGFMRDAFGFVLRSDWRDPSDAEHVNIEVELDGAIIGIGRAAKPRTTALDPSEPRMGLYVVVDDVDAHYERARNAGATITFELADQPWGHRMYGAIDPEGHEWGFASPTD
jgi:uncharacterized glyoxalase superfamily protein PhnB